MDFILGILTCICAGILGMLVLLYQKLDRLTIVATNQRANEFQEAANTPKTRRTIFAPKVTQANGRAVKDQDNLVDLSELDSEVGIAALEHMVEEN